MISCFCILQVIKTWSPGKTWEHSIPPPDSYSFDVSETSVSYKLDRDHLTVSTYSCSMYVLNTIFQDYLLVRYTMHLCQQQTAL